MHCHLLDVADELNEKGCAEFCTSLFSRIHENLGVLKMHGKITARPEKQKGEIRARLGKHGKVIARVAFETRPFE